MNMRQLFVSVIIVARMNVRPKRSVCYFNRNTTQILISIRSGKCLVPKVNKKFRIGPTPLGNNNYFVCGCFVIFMLSVRRCSET